MRASKITVLNLPNFLTLLRICSIPLFLIFLLDEQMTAALVVFVLGGITDSLDGAIARLTNTRTTLGAYMDPVADKMLILSTFVAFSIMGVVPQWLTVVVISRDVFILMGYLILFLLTQDLMEIRPSLTSKITTFFQLSTLVAVLVSLQWPAVLPELFRTGLYVVTGLMTAASGLQYIVRGLGWYSMRSSES